MLEDVPGILIINCCRRDELQEECLSGLFVSRVAFNLDGWCSGLMVVPYYLDISPNAMKGCIYVGAGPEDRLELTGQCYSLDVGGGETQPSTGSWKHAVVWVNNDDPVWVRGSELRDEGCCTDAGMYLDACLQGEEVLVLLLEQSGDDAVFEVVLKVLD